MRDTGWPCTAADATCAGRPRGVGRALRALALAIGAALLLQACSTVKLAYNQVTHLAYWQLNSHFSLSQAQAERVRSELEDLHQWHRETMLPRHAELLQDVQRQLASDVSAGQVCAVYEQVRTQIDRVTAQAEPKLAGLAAQLSDAQIRNLQKKQASSNAEWKKEWLDASPEALREQRYKQLLSRAEGFYGTLQAPQQAALRNYVALSSFDPERTYAERLRRQQDLVQVLRQIVADPANTERHRSLLRGYLERFNASPEPAYQRYARKLVEEGCAGFAMVHRAMTPAQRLTAVQSAKGYEQDFWVLAGR